MRRLLIACAAVSAIGALAWAQPAAKPCCELWIFEAADGPDAYALKSRRSGQTFAVVPYAAGVEMLEGEAARAVVRRWTAISQLAASTSILLDAREARINLDVDVVDPPDAPDNNGANTLVIIRNATPAQTRRFISEMPRLSAAARAHLASAIAED